MKICILGDGSWGTALALNLHYNQHQVTLWGRSPEHMEAIRRDGENKRFLPGIPVPPEIETTADLPRAVNGCDMLVLGTPSQYMRGTLEKLAPHIDCKNQIVVNIAKGIETGSLLRMSELCRAILGNDVRYTVLSGPSHAEEVSKGIPTLVVAASDNLKDAKKVQMAFHNDRFRVYTSKDVVGVELGGALKNVFAIAAGIIDGIGLGDNSKAALMTRGCAELSRLGVKLGGRRQTFSGLGGIGDLIVTCMSRHSRNRYVGEELGKGRKLQEITTSMNNMVAEGVKTCESAKMLAEKVGVETPLVNGVYEVLFNDRPPREIIYKLMTRKAKAEL